MRNSLTRNTIINILETSDVPVAATELIEKIHVNKTTIYRELDFLMTQNLVSQVDFSDGKKRYELTTKGHHHHLICTHCGSVECVEVQVDLSKPEQEFKRLKNFSVTSHTLEFFGHCTKCQ